MTSSSKNPEITSYDPIMRPNLSENKSSCWPSSRSRNQPESRFSNDSDNRSGTAGYPDYSDNRFSDQFQLEIRSDLCKMIRSGFDRQIDDMFFSNRHKHVVTHLDIAIFLG